MRIAHLSVFYPYRGGIAQFNANLFRELEKDHEIKAFNFTRQYPKLLFPGKTQTVSESDLADPIESIAVLDSINPLSWGKTARAICEYSPDLVLLRYWTPALAPALTSVIRKVKKKLPHVHILSILDNVVPHEKRFFDDFLTRRFLNSCDSFLVMSEQVKQELLQFRSKAKVIFKAHPIYSHFAPAIDKNKARKRLGLPLDERIILFFGFIRPYKGLDVLLEAIPKTSTQLVTLIAGECYGSFEVYEKLIDKGKITDEVIVMNQYLDDSQVADIFSAVDLCVLPYKSATQSGIIPVAYHYGLPVISTDVGGLKEYLKDGSTGYIVPPENPRALATAIDKYFELEREEAFSINIREFSRQHSWAAFARELLSGIKT